MCGKGDLWVEGSKPVSQEVASLPTISSLQSVIQRSSKEELSLYFSRIKGYKENRNGK